MHLSLHKILLSLLICSLAGPALHADTASSTPVKSDINQARITDGNFKFPGIIASDPASVASLTQQAASIAGEIPVQEIPAIDNLLQVASQALPQINNLAKPVIKTITGASPVGQPAKVSSEVATSVGLELKSAIDSETTLTASGTAEIKGKKDSEYIDTLFPDPLSPDFPSESGISAAEKNRPAKEVIDEINQKAEEIAERTAKELGIDYVPPSERLPKTEPGEQDNLTASASGDLETDAPEIASGEAKVATEVDSGSWEYPGDTRASATAEVKKPQTALPVPKRLGSAVKENEITEEPETNTAPGTEPAKTSDRTPLTKPKVPEAAAKGKLAAPAGAAGYDKPARPGKLPEQAEPVKLGKLIEATVTADDGTASGSENIGEELAGEELASTSETVVTDTENEIIPVQWPDSPEDPEFATGSQQLFSEKTASATISSGELPGLFEKAEALAPALMTRGKPENELSDADAIKKITGRLVPEKQPLGRRRHLYRWVLKTDDGRRIPLKSNLKLLTEVRNEKMLDGKVNLTGRFIKSAMNEELQYFVVESATFADSSNASGSADIKTGKRSGQPVKAKDEADKIGSNHKSGSSGTKNAAKKQDLPAGDQNLKKAPLPKQP